MSRNYDNWERLVAAVLKKELIRQLCHQDSVSTIYSDYSSSRLDSTLPLSLGSFIDIFESVQQLHKGESGTTILAESLQDLRVSDHRYFVGGTKVVVKSTTSSKITEDEIEQHMFALAIFRHENVAIPWAYHFSEMIKFLVYDYYSKGSVFDMMHGKRNRPSLASRVRIAVGAARGIAYIHAQSGGEMVHGNIKSSNIFLNSKNLGCVSGFGFGSKKNEPDQQYLPIGTKVIVKTLGSSKITQDEFEGHMIALGNCRHENVGTPWACHFTETKKLIFYDYHNDGSAYEMLHGNDRESNTVRPNWESRLRIAVGAARGIAHIHAQCGGELIHGNIKSSNIFINSQKYGCVSDFGLVGIPGVMAPKWWGALEYYSLEHKYKNLPSQGSDVYNFGLVLLELLTGRSPVRVPYIANHLRRSESDSLDMIVYKPRVFPQVDEVDYMDEMALDKFPFVDERLRDSVVHEELRKMLLVAKRCLDELPDQRPTMSQVVFELENIAALSHERDVVGKMAALSDRHVEKKKRTWLGLFPFGR